MKPIVAKERYGHWQVLYQSDTNSRKYHCRCDCGTEREVSISQLANGKTKSCGCVNKRNLIGTRHGKVIVISETKRRYSDGSLFWLCKCDCGKTVELITSRLLSGYTVSCGCYRKRKIQYGLSSINAVYNIYRRCARDRSIEFDITKEQFIKITSRNCVYCDSKPSNIKRNLSKKW